MFLLDYMLTVYKVLYTLLHTLTEVLLCAKDTHSQAGACLTRLCRKVFLEAGGREWCWSQKNVDRTILEMKYEAGKKKKKKLKLFSEVCWLSRVIPVMGMMPGWQKESSSSVPLWCKEVQWVLKKSPKKQPVCEFKSCTVRSEYSSVCSQLRWWTAALLLHLEKHTALCAHIKLFLTHTRKEFTHTHSFHRSWAKWKCSEGEQAGIMDLIQEGREKEGERERKREREGGVGERRERWEVRGGEWKGAGTCTVLFPMRACVCVCVMHASLCFLGALSSLLWSFSATTKYSRESTPTLHPP